MSVNIEYAIIRLSRQHGPSGLSGHAALDYNLLQTSLHRYPMLSCPKSYCYQLTIDTSSFGIYIFFVIILAKAGRPIESMRSRSKRISGNYHQCGHR